MFLLNNRHYFSIIQKIDILFILLIDNLSIVVSNIFLIGILSN